MYLNYYDTATLILSHVVVQLDIADHNAQSLLDTSAWCMACDQ